VLRDALAGNSRTALVANVWPEAAHAADTVSTLRLAARVRAVSTVPRLLEAADPEALLRRYKRQICDLRAELAMRDAVAGRPRVDTGDLVTPQEADLGAAVAAFLAGSLALDGLPLDTLASIKAVLVHCQSAYQTAAAAPGGSAEHTHGSGRAGKQIRGAQDADPVDAGVGELAEVAGFGIGTAPDSSRPPAVRAPAPSATSIAPAARANPAPRKAVVPLVGSAPAPRGDDRNQRGQAQVDRQAAFAHFKTHATAGKAAEAERRAARVATRAAETAAANAARQVLFQLLLLFDTRSSVYALVHL
jgi:kinesin family protein 6/9